MELVWARWVTSLCKLIGTFVASSLVILAVWGCYVFYSPGAATDATNIVFSRGLGLREIAQKLYAYGVIDRTNVFRIGARILGKSRQLKAGEFHFPAHASPMEVAEILVAGKTVVRRLMVPEGLMSAEILEILSVAEGLTGVLQEIQFEEGILMPDTYHFSFGDQRTDILERMRAAMAKTLDVLWQSRAKNLPLSRPYDALILASIIERETAIAEERSKIAGVFINRLRRGMRLQSDPTVAYAVTDGRAPLERALTSQDLRMKHPYNTYVSNGLPPSPICNPGKESLKAAMNPAKTKALYFVADASGGHAFASTLEQHKKNVARWRKTRGANK